MSYRRGDLSPCGTLRFYQYQSYVSKKTGRRAERWIPADKFNEYRDAQAIRNELSAARSDYIRNYPLTGDKRTTKIVSWIE
jgi:hypothetical protein